MALTTPTSSPCSTDAIDLKPQDDDTAAAGDGDVIAKNRLVIRKHKDSFSSAHRLLSTNAPDAIAVGSYT
jgi:hypothetical protein